MAGSIFPLPVMDEEAIALEKKEHLKKKPPETLVVRYSYQRKMAELKFDGDYRPGCGTKVVIRSPRGTEMAELVTTVCGNGGCNHSVQRDEMVEYIKRSGGKDYPITREGRILRVANSEDTHEQERLDARKPELTRLCKSLIRELELDMSLIEVELLLDGEKIVFYYGAEEYVDFRELVKRLGSELKTRVELVQVNAREEARLVADYEKCGQHVCCKQFLKVLKPVSMRSAKVQKATLDPQKISGRCGRLMCCLRYEDKTYSELKKNLPNRKSPVETPDGVGIVLNSQILTQLVLVKIPDTPAPAAYPVEDIRVLTKEEAAQWRDQQAEIQKEREEAWRQREERRSRRSESPKPSQSDSESNNQSASGDASTADGQEAGERTDKPKRRRRRRKPRSETGEGQAATDAPNADSPDGAPPSQGYTNKPHEPQGSTEGEGGPPKKRRRRRRRRGPGSGPEGRPGGGGNKPPQDGGPPPGSDG